MKTILSAGHICLDMTPVIPGKKYSSLGEFLMPGGLTQTEEMTIHLGGSVGNTGLALKKLGADVRLLGKTGDDAFGRIVRQLVADQGGTGVITDPNTTTSYTIVIAAPGLDRCFLHHSGANDCFDASDISDDALEGAALFHFGYPTLMRRMYENTGEQLMKMFAHVKAQKVATSLDLSSVDPLGPAGQVDWQAVLGKTLPYVDFFLPSYEELLFMLDRKRWKAVVDRGEAFDEHLRLAEDAVPLAKAALGMGCRAVLLKCGTAGMVLVTSDMERMAGVGENLGLDPVAWSNQELCQTCYPAETVRSATGAGDVSIAAFLLAVTEKKMPTACVQLAAAEGACAVTTYDTLSGLQPLGVLEQRIRDGWN